MWHPICTLYDEKETEEYKESIRNQYYKKYEKLDLKYTRIKDELEIMLPLDRVLEIAEEVGAKISPWQGFAYLIGEVSLGGIFRVYKKSICNDIDIREYIVGKYYVHDGTHYYIVDEISNKDRYCFIYKIINNKNDYIDFMVVKPHE